MRKLNKRDEEDHGRSHSQDESARETKRNEGSDENLRKKKRMIENHDDDDDDEIIEGRDGRGVKRR